MRKRLFTLAAAALVVATLSGCSAINSTIYSRHEEYFDTYAQASDGWVGGSIPTWIPTNSTAVRSSTTNNGDQRIIRVETESEPVGTCEEAPAPELEALPSGWTPQIFPDEVTVCGDYSLIEADGGWFGWYASAAAAVDPTANTTK